MHLPVGLSVQTMIWCVNSIRLHSCLSQVWNINRRNTLPAKKWFWASGNMAMVHPGRETTYIIRSKGFVLHKYCTVCPLFIFSSEHLISL